MGGIDFHDEAAELESNVSKPWGDSSRYEVSVEDEGRFRTSAGEIDGRTAGRSSAI